MQNENGQGFNEGRVKFSSKDIRFNQKGKVPYATLLGTPDDNVIIQNLSTTKGNNKIQKIELLGSKEKNQMDSGC